MRCVQTVKDQDLELMDDVSNLVQRKSQMMAELKALLDEALSGTHKRPDGSFQEDFQHLYTGKVAEVLILHSSDPLRPHACHGQSACIALSVIFCMGAGHCHADDP